MLACWSVGSYHIELRPKVELEVTLNRQREVMQTDGQFANVIFLLLHNVYLFHNFSNSFNKKTTDLHWNLC